MDFEAIKKKAIELQKQAAKKLEEAAVYSAKKLAESSVTINSKEEFEKIIAKSKTTSFTNKETGITKKYKHKSVIIIGEEKSDFFKDALLNFPILVTKAFSQGITLKLSKSEIKEIDLKEYKIKEFPVMLVFEEEKLFKTIEGKENIEKLVKSMDLDINKGIEEA